MLHTHITNALDASYDEQAGLRRPPPPVPVAPTTRPTTEPTLSSAILYAPYTVRIQSPLQEREEQLKLQQQYASLPESVKASMGIATPCGEAGPSSGAGGMH